MVFVTPVNMSKKKGSKLVINYRECYICMFDAIITFLLYNFIEDHIKKITSKH